MTLTSRLFRLFSIGSSRSVSSRSAVPRLDALHLSSHDLADLNLPPSYRSRLDADCSLGIPGQHR